MDIIYDIVEDENIYDFKDKVNNLLKAGWELQGGVSYNDDRHGFKTYCQALIWKINKEIQHE